MPQIKYLMKLNLKFLTGFTIIELLLVVGITAIIAVVGFLNIYGFKSESELDLTVREIVSVLRNAQDRSMSQEDSSQWGVYFENPLSNSGFYVLYQGATTTFFSKKNLRSNIQFLNPSIGSSKDVSFNKMSGLPNSSTTIQISLKNNPLKTRTIIINANGQISSYSSYWVNLSQAPDFVSGGALINIGIDTIYALRSSNFSDFWQYTISINAWQALPAIPQECIGNGPDHDLVAVGNNFVYMLCAADVENFWRYNISMANWENLADIPDSLYYPIALTAVDNEIFANIGTSINNFYKYSISTGNWTLLANSSTLGNGSDITAVGTDTIYATQGGNDVGFYKYTISSNTWSFAANATAGVYHGGSLTTVDTDIYAFRGYDTDDFWKYDTLTGEWLTATDAPAGVYSGGSLTAVGSNIYAFRGNETTDFWKYTIY